jgi:acetolactate decarboxylase
MNCKKNIEMFSLLLVWIMTTQLSAQIKVVGTMRQTMWQGHLFGKIDLDTIQHKKNLYGLGPLAYLSGELMILDGKTYKSTVGKTKNRMLVEETFKVQAPFFVYTTVENWIETPLPVSISNLMDLEIYLDSISQKMPRPFAFRLVGSVDSAVIHIVNVGKGASVKSPDDAHKTNVEYHLTNETVEILGFFSTEHKAIFTHHDTFLHLHLLTADKTKMGHLDRIQLKKGTVKLYLPKNTEGG